MKNLIYIFLACMTIVLTSCSVTNEIHVNKDYSGDYAMKLDFSGIMEMMQAFGEEDAAEEMDMLDEVFADGEAEQVDSIFNAVDGISNAKLSMSEENEVVLSFDFEDFESLDRVLTQMQDNIAQNGDMGDNMMMPGMDGISLPSFTKKGKTVTHQATLPADQMNSMLGGEDMQGMEGALGSMFDVQIIMTFDRKVKDVKVNNMDIMAQEKKMVKTRVDMNKFFEEGSYSIDVSLK